MSVTLTRTDSIANHTGTSGASGSWTGTTFTISTTAAAWLWYVSYQVCPGQVLASGEVTVTVPAGSVGGSYYTMWVFQDAVGGVTGTSTGPTVVAPGPGTYALTIPSTIVPSGTVVALLRPGCNVGGTAGRKLTEVSHVATTTATPDEILSASLERDLRRVVMEPVNASEALINSATPGLMVGQITYLCSTLADAIAVDALYQGHSTATLSTGSGNALQGFKHKAVEKIRLSAERAVPGYPSKWLATVTVRERTA